MPDLRIGIQGLYIKEVIAVIGAFNKEEAIVGAQVGAFSGYFAKFRLQL